jgi:hypothetical protein
MDGLPGENMDTGTAGCPMLWDLLEETGQEEYIGSSGLGGLLADAHTTLTPLGSVRSIRNNLDDDTAATGDDGRGGDDTSSSEHTLSFVSLYEDYRRSFESTDRDTTHSTAVEAYAVTP